MGLLHDLYNELISFLGIGQFLEMSRTGDYSRLHTIRGIVGTLSPVVPFLLIVEIIRAILYKRFRIEDFKMGFLAYVSNRLLSQFIAISAVGFCIGVFQKFAFFSTQFTWYWFLYGYVIWELGHFIYHYLSHKVRLFWCLHSTHHAPVAMNLSVTYTHFFLEAPYSGIIRTTTCVLLGVNPPMLFFIMFIDGVWSAFTHVGENLVRDGRFGLLNKIILTPSHHRVHHARNPMYIDTNFCNLLNIWDLVFRTYQEEEPGVKIEYGITRPLDPGNFWDVYFGEFYYLFKDVYNAPGLLNKVLYIFMPPGWSHTGEHKTAAVDRRKYLSTQTRNPAGQ